MTQKSYTDGTPAVNYTYDAAGVSNSLGHLTQLNNGWAIENYTAFDGIGNVTASNEQTASHTYPFSYSYSLANALTIETYPSGRVVTNAYDSANRPYTTTGTFNGTQTNYITYTGYWPHGAAWQTNYGSGLTAVEGYNSRLQPSAIWALLNNDYGQVLFGEQPNWGTTNNNGNVQGSTTYAGGPGPYQSLPQTTQGYGYDNLNRLISVSDSGGYSRAFSYDPYGNMWVNLAGTSGIPPAGNTPISNVYNGANQITGMTYDASGNMQSVNGNWVNYDAENRQISEIDGVTQAVETYAYDGEGRRVEKSGPAGTTAYIYDAFGQLIAEYSTAGSEMSCQTCYLSYDHLGSVRLVTDQSNQILSRHDYLPFGEEIPAGIGGRSGAGWGPNDGIAQRFTGKERDAETGLDYFGARYYGSALGRFTSADPVVITTERLMNPQQLNLYAYVENNPLRFIDPTGEILQCVGGADSRKQCFLDLQQIAGDAASRLSMDAKTGVVSFDTKGLDMSKNEGAALVNDLVGSKNTYDFSVGPTIMTDKGQVRIDKLTGGYLANLPTFGDQRPGGNPPPGVSDIFGIYLDNPNLTRRSLTDLKSAQEWTIAFHELAEAFEKIDGGKGGSYEQGHNAAFQREMTLRDQRPYLKQYNTGAGGPANSPNPQGSYSIIIKK